MSVIFVLLKETFIRNMLYSSENCSWFTFLVCNIKEYVCRTSKKAHFLKLTSAWEGPCWGLFRYPFNSSHYSIFCSQYWNVPNNMLFEGKLGSNLSSLCVLSRAGGRGKQGFTASHGAVISNSWQSQTKTLFLWLPHCNNRVQRTDCLQAKNQSPRNTENSSSQFFW